MCTGHSSAAVNVVNKLNVGAQGASALHKSAAKTAESTPQPVSPALFPARLPPIVGSPTFFLDNLQNQDRGTARARSSKPLHIPGRVIAIAYSPKPSSAVFRAHYAPLLASPLRKLSLADFEPTESDTACLRRFFQHEMELQLSLALVDVNDFVSRKEEVAHALHVDAVSCRVCVNPTCKDRFQLFYHASKRLCPVSMIGCSSWCCVAVIPCYSIDYIANDVFSCSSANKV
jgi:hypothetical protein